MIQYQCWTFTALFAFLVLLCHFPDVTKVWPPFVKLNPLPPCLANSIQVGIGFPGAVLLVSTNPFGDDSSNAEDTFCILQDVTITGVSSTSWAEPGRRRLRSAPSCYSSTLLPLYTLCDPSGGPLEDAGRRHAVRLRPHMRGATWFPWGKRLIGCGCRSLLPICEPSFNLDIVSPQGKAHHKG